MLNTLPTSVQLQYMRPRQVQAAGEACPVVYVPFGLIEWHGRHMPLGVDALKAHAFAVKTAERYGGLVYPPIYFHNLFDQTHLRPVLAELFERLRNMGFRVVIGISGHNNHHQLAMIEAALQPVIEGTPPHIEDKLYRPGEPHGVAGLAIWETTLSECEDSQTDHAAKWETSDMLFFYPELVDLEELDPALLAPGQKELDGIGSLDPREHASAEVGRRNVELATEAIGRKARELLESLPADQRGFNNTLSPQSWWFV